MARQIGRDVGVPDVVQAVGGEVGTEAGGAVEEVGLDLVRKGGQIGHGPCVYPFLNQQLVEPFHRLTRHAQHLESRLRPPELVAPCPTPRNGSIPPNPS